MTAPYIPPRKSLRDALTAANMGMSVNPTTPDRTATPGYQPPPTPVMSAATPRPRMTPQSDLANALRGEDMGDTPMGFLNEVLNPIRQGAQARQLLGDAVQSVSRNRIARGVGQGALGLAAVIPGVPDEIMQGVRRLYHGSPIAGITSFDRLAPRALKSKVDRFDSAGTWFAESPDDVQMFTRGFDEAGQPITGGVYEADVHIANPKEYASFDELMDDFNRATGREAWVGKRSAPNEFPFTARGIAPEGGNKMNEYLRKQGYDGIKVTEAKGIDRPGGPQTYWMSLEPESKVKIVKRPER